MKLIDKPNMRFIVSMAICGLEFGPALAMLSCPGVCWAALRKSSKPDYKPRRNSRPTIVAVQRRNLIVDKVPVDLACELRQLVPHIDDLIQPRAEQITRSSRLVLLRSHCSLQRRDRITS